MRGDVECRIRHGTQSRNRTPRFSARITRVLNVRALLACMCCAITLAFAAPTETPDKARELRELRERIEKLQRDLVKSEESRSEAADALRTSEKSISEVNRNLLTLAREQARISRSLAELKGRIEATRTDAAQQQDLLERMIRHQYMHGNTDGLRLLLEGKDVSEVERRMRYLGYVCFDATFPSFTSPLRPSNDTKSPSFTVLPSTRNCRADSSMASPPAPTIDGLPI